MAEPNKMMGYKMMKMKLNGRVMALLAVLVMVAVAWAIDNTNTNIGTLVTNGQANAGETAVATVSHALVDVNGNIALQVGTSGKVYLANGTSVAGGPVTPAPAALTDGSTITWTVDPTQNEQIATVTLGGSRTLAFSGLISGMHGTLFVTQDSTGSRTLTLPTNVNPGTVTLSTTASYTDKLTWHYVGTTLYFDNVVTHYH